MVATFARDAATPFHGLSSQKITFTSGTGFAASWQNLKRRRVTLAEWGMVFFGSACHTAPSHTPRQRPSAGSQRVRDASRTDPRMWARDGRGEASIIDSTVTQTLLFCYTALCTAPWCAGCGQQRARERGARVRGRQAIRRVRGTRALGIRSAAAKSAWRGLTKLATVECRPNPWLPLARSRRVT